ncbi:hypothetical protein AB2B38_010090 [Balneola sp. MJW-20]
MKTERNSSITRVKEMPVSYLDEVLPQPLGEIELYKDGSEVTGEYIELGIVEIKEINTDNSYEAIMDRLKKEAKDLRATGVLLLSDQSSLDKGVEHRELKAVAIYALDKAILNEAIVAL